MPVNARQRSTCPRRCDRQTGSHPSIRPAPRAHMRCRPLTISLPNRFHGETTRLRDVRRPCCGSKLPGECRCAAGDHCPRCLERAFRPSACALAWSATLRFYREAGITTCAINLGLKTTSVDRRRRNGGDSTSHGRILKYNLQPMCKLNMRLCDLRLAMQFPNENSEGFGSDVFLIRPYTSSLMCN